MAISISPSKRRLFACTLVLTGLYLTWGPLSRSAAYIKDWLFPRDVELFVVDQRVGGDFPRDLERVYSKLRQRHDGVRVVVRRVEKEEAVRLAEHLFDKFEQTRHTTEASKLFVELPAPYSCSKKALRRAIDEQQRFTKDVRTALLQRVVALVGARPGSAQDVCSGEVDANASSADRDACRRLSDDWAYTGWTFGGIGLVVDERTMDLVGQCLPRLTTQAPVGESTHGGVAA